MQFPLLTAPLSWQGPMHFHYRDSKITIRHCAIAIIAISILSLSTIQHSSLNNLTGMRGNSTNDGCDYDSIVRLCLTARIMTPDSGGSKIMDWFYLPQ